MAEQAQEESNVRLILVVYLILFILSQIPIWTVVHVPLQDYPNHLARIYLLENLQAIPALQKFYEASSEIIPNLAMDLVTPAFTRVVSLETAGKLTLALVVLGITGGALFLQYALHRKVGYWPLLTFLILFNEALLKGFINFLLGIGLAIWGIGLWIAMRECRGWQVVSVFSLLSIVLFLFHLAAFGVFAVTILCYELGWIVTEKWHGRPWSIRNLTIGSFQLIVPVALYLRSPTGVEDAPLVFASIYDKVFHYPFNLLSQYSHALDSAVLLGVVFILAIAIWKKRLRFHPYMVAPVVVMFIAYLLMPSSLASAKSVDWRMLVPLSILVLCSLMSVNEVVSVSRRVCALVILLFAGNVSVVLMRWESVQQEYGEILAAIDTMEPGARLFTARGFISFSAECPPFVHVPTLAIVRRSAFVPSLFAYETQQPVRFTRDFRDIARRTSKVTYSPVQRVPWELALRHYDYVLLAREDVLLDVPRNSLREVFRGRNIALYRPAAAP